jgi:translation initiation factor IF-3
LQRNDKCLSHQIIGNLIASSKKNITPINEKIRATEVMLIGSNGEKQGLVAFSVALESARVSSLDLVQVSPPDANPIVCKLLDYGKHVFDKKKSLSSSKVKVKRNTVKEIKFRPSTDIGDYNIKLKKIKSFILDGDKTKISVRFRGREILNSDMGLNLLNRLRDELEEIAQVDQEPSLEGRQLLMVLSPLKKK